MIWQLYLALVVIASCVTLLVMVAGAKGSIGGISVERRLGIVLSGVAFVLWGLIAINSFEITVYSGTETHVESYEQLAWVGALGGAIALYSMLQATLEEINATGGI